MKWFEHECAARDNRKLRRLVRLSGNGRSGMAALGSYWCLVEVIGNLIDGKPTDGYLPLDYDMEDLAYTLGFESTDQLREFLDQLAGCGNPQGLIDKSAWSQGQVYMPQLLERCDNYHRKLSRQIQKYGQCTDSVQTDAGQCPDSVQQSPPRREENREQESRREEKKIDENRCAARGSDTTPSLTHIAEIMRQKQDENIEQGDFRAEKRWGRKKLLGKREA